MRSPISLQSMLLLAKVWPQSPKLSLSMLGLSTVDSDYQVVRMRYYSSCSRVSASGRCLSSSMCRRIMRLIILSSSSRRLSISRRTFTSLVNSRSSCSCLSAADSVCDCSLAAHSISFGCCLSSLLFLRGMIRLQCKKEQRAGLIILLMEGNFNINLPSIPGRVLKFKIQDVRVKGFEAREARFKDDKEYLTKRFINSFGNLQAKPHLVAEPKSEPSTSVSSCFREEQDNFRWMVGDDKKNLLIKYEDHYKSYQPPLPSLDVSKGYSFPRQGAKDSLDYQLKQYQSQLLPEEKSIDNYYFNMTEQSDEENEDDLERRRAERLQKKKHVKPTAAFKSEDRWQDKQRQLRKKIKVGPGSYVLETIKHSPLQKRKADNPEESLPVKEKLKEFLKDYREYSPILQSQDKKKEIVNRKSSCFAEANVDRFGNQKYPTLVKLNVPGPGSYETHGSLQEKAKRILIVEEQRKLLREWYNDGQ